VAVLVATGVGGFVVAGGSLVATGIGSFGSCNKKGWKDSTNLVQGVAKEEEGLRGQGMP
jgi:hypothetical protein